LVLSKSPVTQKLDRFFASPGYILALMAVSMAAHLMHWELAAYTVFALIAAYACVVSKDFLPVAPLFIFSYILPSAQNNPGKNEASVFVNPWFFLLALVVFLSFLIFIGRNIKRFFSCDSRLIWGMVALCVAYQLSGIGSAAYSKVAARNTLFAAAQSLSLILPYLLLAVGTDWSKVRKDYLAWIGTCAGILLLVEVFWSYINGGVIVDGVINRKKIFTGWGMYNNMGAMLSMAIPFAFHLCCHHRKGWLGTVLGGMFLVGVVMTCSRTAMVAALGIYGLCVLILLMKSPNRKRALIGIGVLAALAATTVAIFHKPLLHLFDAFLKKLTDLSSRHIIFAEGWKQFLEAPIFGSSFFSPGLSKAWDFSTIDSFTGFFPPRWHNTFIQLLASCGAVGVVAYLWHRAQTLRLFFRRKGASRLFMGCSIGVLLGCSLLDCHFFNIGPVLFYSVILAFMEFLPAEE